MGGAVSTRMRLGRGGDSHPPSSTTSNSSSTTQPTRPPMIVVQGRYDPYPGQADPNITWITPRGNAENDDEKGPTPMANPGVNPSVAAPIPYTPEGGYPPVILLTNFI